MPYITTISLEKTVKEMLEKWGVPENQAKIITETVVYAHTHEKHTHGITRMPIYKTKMDNNLMPSITNVEIVSETPALSVMDCNNGFGQIAAYEGMMDAIKRARLYGIGACFVRNSNNFGVAGYFGELAANEGMLGMIVSASGPAIAPEGGTKNIFGTNPICYAFPTSDGNVVLDMAITAAARGKIRLAQRNGEKIPYGWAVDKNGNPTDDPTKALEGNMLAIGGVKGFGLAMVIDMMAGLLSGSAFGGNIKPLGAKDGYSRHGHMMLSINIEALMPQDEYQEKIEEFVKNIKACGKSDNILLPGENSRKKAAANKVKFELKEKMINDFNQIAEDNGLVNRLEIVEK